MPITKENIRYHIDLLDISFRSIRISGWMFHPSKRIKKLFLKVNEKKYEATEINLERKDVQESFRLTNSLHTGFVCEAPIEKVSSQIYFLIEFDNEVTNIFLKKINLINFYPQIIKKYFKNVYLKLRSTLLFLKLSSYKDLLNFVSEFKIIPSLIKPEIKPKHKDYIVLVVHELTRTGAPILGLNLVNFFNKKYNVILISLGDGPLENDFKKISYLFIKSKFIKNSAWYSFALVKFITKKFKIKFAIINSAESRSLLPGFQKYLIPTVCLIHEFTTNTKPINAVLDCCLLSTATVFSSNITYDNFIYNFPEAENIPYKIIPQGLWENLKLIDNKALQGEIKRIDGIFSSENKKQINIVGCGYVQYRKGVDLFIDLAAKILKNNPGCVHFYWVGGGYDPLNDGAYSCFLQDSIYRYNIQDKFTFVHESIAFDYILKLSDIFVLTSRLDPLPSVVMEAMFHKLPIVCFDKASGFAEFIKANHLAKFCLSNYLDLDEMSSKIKFLISSKKTRESIGVKLHNLTLKEYNNKNYHLQIETLAEESIKITKRKRKDIGFLINSEALDFNFLPTSLTKLGKIKAAELYIESWSREVRLVKPFSGFHPGIYAEKNKLLGENVDPLVHYLTKNKPPGPWAYPVINFSNNLSGIDSANKVAIHIHVHYADLLPSIISRLMINKTFPDLFITLSDRTLIKEVKKSLLKYKGVAKEIKITPNKGRNFGAFLVTMLPRLSSQYEFIVHLHTKKSLHTYVGSDWLNFILDSLIGVNSKNMMDNILHSMIRDKKIGIVFPDDPYAVGWTKNREISEVLGKKLFIHNLPKYFIFPVGGMFIVRRDALAPIKDLEMNYDLFPDEPVPIDGTILHAIERMLPFTVQKAGFKVATCIVGGSTRI